MTSLGRGLLVLVVQMSLAAHHLQADGGGQKVSGTSGGNRGSSTFGLLESEYHHQVVVLMEDDPVVARVGRSLFFRSSTTSTLLAFQKGQLLILSGGPRPQQGRLDVLLVGHGSRDGDEQSWLAARGPEELARTTADVGRLGQIGSVTLMSCHLGSDPHFTSRLLRALKVLRVETKLYLHSSLLSVSPDGEVLTTDDGVWRSHDHSKRILAELDPSGNLLRRRELGVEGRAFPHYRGEPLFHRNLDWPKNPQMFIPAELRKRYPSVECLEALTWSLFFEENERKRAHDYPLHLRQEEVSAVWLKDPEPDVNTLVLKHITSIQDLLVEIRHNAREEPATDLHYVLNDVIYRFQWASLNVSLAGKFIRRRNFEEAETFRQSFSDQQDLSSMRELRRDLKPASFNDFCRQTFQVQQCTYNCERWGHYFMVAVFSQSVRNFRTFSLFLMSVIGCEVGRRRGSDSSLCTAFAGADHPMDLDWTWPPRSRRGFFGCTVENFEVAPRERQMWLDNLVAREHALFTRSKQIMGAVDHDEQTELDVFGRVKVLNTYAFSSYLKYFQGTTEGRTLKKGCYLSFYES